VEGGIERAEGAEGAEGAEEAEGAEGGWPSKNDWVRNEKLNTDFGN